MSLNSNGYSNTIHAVVLTGNRHILKHALQALDLRGIKTSNVLLVVTSMIKTRRDEVWAELIQHPWNDVVIGYDLAQSKFKGWLFGKYLQTTFLFELALVCSCLRQARSRIINTDTKLLFSGFYGHPIDTTIANEIGQCEFILVDDGNMTFEIASKRSKERKAGFKNVYRLNSTYNWQSFSMRLKLYLMSWICQLNSRGIEKIHFFTHHHNLQIENPDEIVPVKVDLMNQVFSVDPSLVHILGMPAVTRDIIDEVEYFMQLRIVSEQFGKVKFEYYPHPAEGESERNIVSRAIPNVCYRMKGVPYEEEFSRMSVLPSKVIGFYSSALANIATIGIRDIEIIAYRIDTRKISDESRRKRVDEIYKYLLSIENISLR